MDLTGSTFAGYVSQYIGRRLTIIVLVLWTGAFIPLWIIPSSFSALSAGAFFIQFGVQGAWGVIPIQLAEVSPPAFRATFPGVAYQLGNVCLSFDIATQIHVLIKYAQMISSAASQIEAKGGENLHLIHDEHRQELCSYFVLSFPSQFKQRRNRS